MKHIRYHIIINNYRKLKMITAFTYPFDVIKTNRILQTSFAKETGSSIPREFSSLVSRGGVTQGLYRGMLMYFATNFGN